MMRKEKLQPCYIDLPEKISEDIRNGNVTRLTLSINDLIAVSTDLNLYPEAIKENGQVWLVYYSFPEFDVNNIKDMVVSIESYGNGGQLYKYQIPKSDDVVEVSGKYICERLDGSRTLFLLRNGAFGFAIDRP
jgi:hypothetical protein